MRLADIEKFIQNKRFDFLNYEPRILRFWKKEKIYAFSAKDTGGAKKPFFLIDTPPPYANGPLHHGHGMSYTHIDFIARYRRLKGFRTLFPLCYDDNGLPTEKYTEKKYGIKPGEHPDNFLELCKQEAEQSIDIQTRQLEALGFSYNHEIAYRTIDDRCFRLTQENFLDLYGKGLIKRSYEPQLYCTGCRTALAQADIIPKDELSELHYIKFPAKIGDGETFLIIATSRPEFLPACSAIFFHPDDSRYRTLPDMTIFSPFDGKPLQFLPDHRIDREFGSGLMMCCTFGDQDDITLYRKHGLPLIEIISSDGKMTANAGFLAGMTITEARKAIIDRLREQELIDRSEPLTHTIGTCERCGTPMEITMSWQWTLDILSFKQELLAAAGKINWYPDYMQRRFESWTNGLKWNWLISRQRRYGIPVPAWYCQEKDCGKIILPSRDSLPIDPRHQAKDLCPHCGSSRIIPDGDVFDTWMTSSLTPRILHDIYFGNGSSDFTPFGLRPQAHEIIRTWAFYTIYKELATGSGKLPWNDILISGWGLGFQEKGKRNIKASKSSGGGIDPLELCKEYGADGFRYWAAQARPGKDQHLNEKLLLRGRKLVTKIFNATKIILQLLAKGSELAGTPNSIDGDLLQTENHLKEIIRHYDASMESYSYTDALRMTERSFWNTFCSELIERLKKASNSGQLSKHQALKALEFHEAYLNLLAPFLPFITEYCWGMIWAETTPNEPYRSIHLGNWPGIK